VSPAARRGRRITGPGAAAAALASAAALAVLAGCAAAPAASGDGPMRAAAPARAASGVSGAASAGSCDPYRSSLKPSGPPSVTAGSWMDTIRKRGYLLAGVDQATYHFGYLNPLDRQIEGFDIDQVKAVAAAIFGVSANDPRLTSGQLIHFKAITDPHRIPDVSGQAVNGVAPSDPLVDIVAHTMTINCDRLRQVDFSTVYFDAQRQVLVVKPPDGHPAPDLPRLGAQHLKACAVKGSDSVNSITDAHAVPVTVAYWTDCLVLLQEGQIAGIVTDNSVLEGLKAQDPSTTITGNPLVDEPYGLAISKAHPDLVRFVNAVLAQEIASGQWAASYRHWVDPNGPSKPTWPIGYAG
jgi:polar amino acid transport system substrate-binding protein